MTKWMNGWIISVRAEVGLDDRSFKFLASSEELLLLSDVKLEYEKVILISV